MSDVAIPPRSRPVGVFLVLFAAAAAGLYLALAAGRPVADRGEAIVAASSLVSAVVIRWAVRALRAMVPASTLGALTVWLPSKVHVLQLCVFVVLSAALLLFGREWGGGSAIEPSAFTLLTFVLFPLALAAIAALGPRSAEG